MGQNCDREVRLPGTVAPFPPVLLDLLLSQAMEFSETAWFFVVFLETKGYHGKSMYYIFSTGKLSENEQVLIKKDSRYSDPKASNG